MKNFRSILKPLTVLLISATIGAISVPAQATPDSAQYHQALVAQHLTISSLVESTPVVRDEYTVSTVAIWPTAGHDLTDCFGCRGGSHMGIDISYAGINGTPVHAIASGCISFAGYNGSYGNQVVMSNPGFGVESSYGHLQEIHVGTGQCVNAGDILGLVGSTGGSTGPHLHLEIHIGGIPVDPLLWMLDHSL